MTEPSPSKAIHRGWPNAFVTRLGRMSLPAAVAVALVLAGAAHAKEREWVRVSLGAGGEGAAVIETTLPDGSARTLRPSCSGGPVLVDGAPTQAATDYAFFIQEGNKNKIVISLDGGGACWDDATCILSPLAPELFGGRSTYDLVVDETTVGLAQAGGILDTNNSKNPYRNYTKVFIPYCTGDVHWGSEDKTYDPALLGLKLPPWKIYHRGTDNMLAVLDWLEKHGSRLNKAKKVTVAGASAGGYGANLAFAYVAAMTKSKARLSLLSDSAVGVIDKPVASGSLAFYTTAIYNPGGTSSWGLEQNLPSWVFGDPGQIASFLQQGADNPLGFIPSFFAALYNYRPEANLASITPNTDAVQIGFYVLMKGPSNTDSVDRSAGEWYGAMTGITAATAALPTYRYFIDNSNCHTYIFTDNFYQQGVAEWVSAMVKLGKAWDSVDAGPPNPDGFPNPEDCPQF